MSILRTSIVLLIAALAACSGGSDGVNGPRDPVASVEVSVPRTAIRIGESINAAAVVKDQSGQTLADRTITWSSSDTTVATISATGAVWAIRAGTTAIAATSEGKSGQIAITVSPVPVSVVEVSPSSTSADVGSNVQFSVIVKDSAGRVLTRVVTWESSDVQKASVNGSGLATAVSPGDVDIRATSEGKTGVGHLVVRAKVPVSFSSTGSGQSGTAYSTLPVPLTVTARDASGAPVAGFAITFSVFTGGGSFDGKSTVVATTNSSGVASPGNWTLGGGAGLQIVRATATGMPTIEFLAIAGASLVAIVSGDNQTGRILSDLSAPLVVRITDNLGNPRGGVTVTWSQVSSGGTISSSTSTTTADGRATLATWTLGDVAGTQTLTASAPADVGPVSRITFHAVATGTPVYFKANTVATANGFACAIGQDSGLYCWGGSYGNIPQLQSGVPAFNKLFGDGGTFMCGTIPSGEAYCWGGTYVGDGTTLARPTPTLVSGGRAFVKISVGDQGACAITSTGDPYCWGSGIHQVTGTGSGTASTVPTAVSGGYIFTDIARGTSGACGLDTNSRAFCWGSGWVRGNTNSTDTFVPVAVLSATAISKIGVGGYVACAINKADNIPYCWSDRSSVSPLGTIPLTTLAMGGENFCGLGTGGVAYCWDRNQSGANGSGGLATQLTPAAVRSDLRFSSLDAAGGYACGITTVATVACWGGNESGQLGGPSSRNALSPRQVVLRIDP